MSMKECGKSERSGVTAIVFMIQVIGVIVPKRLRRDWRQEWEAELRYREMLLADWERLNWKTKLGLLGRSLGAFWDALLLQPQRWEEEMFQDLRFGARMLFKHKGFTMTAVLSLALGIGANTALFSVVDAVLIRSLPVPEPDRLVLFEWQRTGNAFRTTGWSGTSYVPTSSDKEADSLFRHDVFEKLLQEQTQAKESPLSDLFAFAPIDELAAVVDEQGEIISGQAVSGGYYAGLKVQPMLGRAITDLDDRRGAVPVV